METNAALMEENRKLQFEVTRLKRALVERLSLDDITSRKLNLCKTELEEERKKGSGKRLHVPNPNYKVILAVRIANSGPHSQVQRTDPATTSDPTIGSKQN